MTFSLVNFDKAHLGLDFTYKKTTSQATIAERIGMEGIIRAGEMRNALPQNVVEIIETTTNVQNRLEARRHSTAVTLSPGCSDE